MAEVKKVRNKQSDVGTYIWTALRSSSLHQKASFSCTKANFQFLHDVLDLVIWCASSHRTGLYQFVALFTRKVSWWVSIYLLTTFLSSIVSHIFCSTTTRDRAVYNANHNINRWNNRVAVNSAITAFNATVSTNNWSSSLTFEIIVKPRNIRHHEGNERGLKSNESYSKGRNWQHLQRLVMKTLIAPTNIVWDDE